MNQDGPSLIIEAPPPQMDPPQNENKNLKKKIHQITSIFYILLSFGVILICLWGLEAYIYKMFMSSVDQYILI